MTDAEALKKYQEAFQNLKATYVKRLANTVCIIDDIFDLHSTRPVRREDLVRAQSLVHGLAGSGSTFGMPDVTQAGQAADHFLEIILKESPAGDEFYAQHRDQFIALLQTVKDVCLAVCEKEKSLLDLSRTDAVYEVPGTPGHAHILIIEDDQEVALAIEQLCTRRGITVKICPRGDEALHYLARTIPNMIILDLILEDMDGIELLQQIRQNSEFYDIPVMVLATRQSEEQRALCLRIGAFAYMAKAVDLDELWRVIDQKLASVMPLLRAL